jgi:hypothetical protein
MGPMGRGGWLTPGNQSAGTVTILAPVTFQSGSRSSQADSGHPCVAHVQGGRSEIDGCPWMMMMMEMDDHVFSARSHWRPVSRTARRVARAAALAMQGVHVLPMWIWVPQELQG